jgi:hypothetical protein
VRVGGHELDSGQAAGDQIPEEAQPAGAVLGAGDLHSEDLPVSVGVHSGRHQRMHWDHAPALTDLEHQRVGGHERERPSLSQRPGAELLDVGVELGGHVRDLGLGQSGDAQ